MRFSTSVFATAGLLSTANAAIKGFNYGYELSEATHLRLKAT
jgi:hypothetical protein